MTPSIFLRFEQDLSLDLRSSFRYAVFANMAQKGVYVMKQVPITKCRYCGSEDIGEGWQHGEALVTFKYRGLRGNRLKYLICRNCGAVLYQCVAEPGRYPKVGRI